MDLKTTGQKISIHHKSEIVGWLRPITKNILTNIEEIHLLAKWRKENQRFFPSQFRVTLKGTKKWAEQELINKKNRILFFIEINNEKAEIIGHMGLNRFDSEKKTGQIDNVVRGKKKYKGIMTQALQTLIEWSFSELSLKHLTLITFADNNRAIALYKRCGFKNKKLIPVDQIKKGVELYWCPIKNKKQAKRYEREMILENATTIL